MIGFNIYFCIKQGKSALLATLKQNRSFEHEYHESIWHMDLFFIRTRIFYIRTRISDFAYGTLNTRFF